MSKFSTFTEMLNHTILEILKGVGTSIPAHVLSFDTETQLAKMQIAVEFIDVQGQTFNLAPIVNVPVHFSGGDFVLEHQIDEGDEGLIIVSQRCIDGWKEQGGVAPQTVLRKLDMQDALFIPGFRSKPKAITNFQNNGIRLRNKNNTYYVWLKNTGDILSENENGAYLLKADGSHKGNNGNGIFELEQGGNFVVNGVTIDTGGNITSPATVTSAVVVAPSVLANGKDVADHNHPAGTPPGNTGNNN